MKHRTTPVLLADSAFGNITEGDCACSSSLVDVSLSDALIHDKFVVSAGLIQQRLNDDFQVLLSPIGGRGASVLNNAAIKILDDFNFQRPQGSVSTRNEINDLTSRFFSQGLVDLPEVNQMYASKLNHLDTLTAWLHLTDRCNFRCSYCYLSHAPEDMSAEIGHAVVDSVLRSAELHNFKKIKLKYAGGEPLLQFPLILELHSYAKGLADRHGLALEETVLSNGSLLTDEILKVFKSLGICLMISLDGLGNYHDLHRSYANGRSSFKDVSDAVDLALENGLLPNISVTVTGKTIEGLPMLVDWILDRSLPFNINFYRENELSASDADLRLEEQKIINGMLAAFAIIESNLPERNILHSIIDRSNMMASHLHTCGVGQNYLVFDQNGRVAKCQMHISKPVTDVTTYDPMAVLISDREDIQNLSVDEKTGCRTCKWKYWCAGGCPLLTYRAMGRYDVKSPNCNIYKTLFPEALRLEGLRILKHENNL
jgi:uncharacterized protein